MSGNFNSFDPVGSTSGNQYSSTIFISAQDRLEEIVVDLKAISCNTGLSLGTPWDWPELNLSGYHQIKMFIKEVGSDELHAEVVGVAVAPLEKGQVLFRLDGSTFGYLYGEYIGLVEVEYKGSDRSGNKITTARNYIPFEVREDFFCDPFDPDFTSCSGGN